jgi:cytochrome c-type biogenesis protein CcmH/NrfF
MSRGAGRALVVLACALLLGGSAIPAVADDTTPTLDELSKKVVCETCGTSLAVAGGPAAEQLRGLIRQMIAQGLTEDQILDRLEAEYGPGVLADPGRSGEGGRWLWLVIVGLGATGVTAVALVARSWSRRADEPAVAPPAGAVPAPGDEPDERLAAALRDLD